MKMSSFTHTDSAADANDYFTPGGYDTRDFIAVALAALMTLGPLAAGMLFWPIHN
jgi:hypothetical protein